MSNPQPPLNKTTAREEALRDVAFGLITYNPLNATYLKGGALVSGPKWRTLSELRSYGYIELGSKTKVAKVKLTDPAGEELAVEWGIKSAAEQAAAE